MSANGAVQHARAEGAKTPAGTGRRNRRRGLTFTWLRAVFRTRAASTASVLAMLAAGLTGPPAAPARAQQTDPTCSFATAGTGTYARTLCWFDMTSYNPTLATSPNGQPMTFTLPGGHSISFTLTASGGAVTPMAFPTYAGAYLGTSSYLGVAGKPALHSDTNAITTLRASNIVATDSAHNEVTRYSFVGADAEETDTGESIVWTSDKPLNLISNRGTACDSFTGADTMTVTCSSSTSSARTGTPILAAEHPSYLQQTMTPRQDSPSSRQAVAFGVLVSTVKLTKQVAGRVHASDSFRVTVSTGSTVLGTADTGTGNTATTGEITVLAATSGQSYVLGETASSGVLANYVQSWACTRNVAGPSLPSGPGNPSATVVLAIGDFVQCTITNTPAPILIQTVPCTASLPDTTPGAATQGLIGPVTVTDFRSPTSSSWVATVSSTVFTAPGGTIGLPNIYYWSGPLVSTTSTTGTLTPGQPTAAQAVQLTQSRIAFSMTGGSPGSTTTWNPTLVVRVPPGAVPGTYTGTIYFSVT